MAFGSPQFLASREPSLGGSPATLDRDACPNEWTFRPARSARLDSSSMTASVEAVTLDEVVNVRASQIEALRGFRNVPAGRLERLLEKLALKTMCLLLKAEVFVP